MPCFENRGLSRRARPSSAVSGHFDSLQSTREYIYFFVPNLFKKIIKKCSSFPFDFTHWSTVRIQQILSFY